VSAFAAALDTLLTDPNLGATAIYQAQGTGPAIAVQVIRSSPDRLGEGFGTGILQATDVLTAAIAALATVEAGDTFTHGTDTLTVQHAERDAAGVAWRVLCRR
jgi:hypothetical protein